jgi:uncharacterized protein YukE
MKVTINKNSITKTSAQMKEATNDFISEIKKFEAVIEGINSAWEGADALKYVNTLKDSYLKKLNELSEYLEKYGDYLENIPGAYSLLDEIYSNKNINI